MTPPPSSPRPKGRLALAGLLGLLAVAGLLGWLGSCGDDGPRHSVVPGPGLYQRLALAPIGPLPDRTPQLVETFEAPKSDDLGTWIVEAPKHDVRNVRNLGGEPDFVKAVWLEGTEKKSLTIPGSYDPRRFNQIILGVTIFGSQPELVRVGLRAQDRPVTQSRWLAVKAGGKRPSTIAFDFPQLRRVQASLDQVVVEFKGECQAACVSRVDLVRVPDASFVPRCEGLGELVKLRDQDRRAVGLSTELPVQARFVAPEHAELSFSFGVRDDLRVPGEKPRLTVTLSAEGIEPVSRSFPMESGRSEKPRWRQGRFDLAAFAGKEVTARFEMDVQGDHEGFCLVSEAAVSRRGTEAPTVLLVTSDTHRADHMGQASDDAPVETPVLDELGHRGVYFTNAYSSTNVTNPSHVSLMTGLTPRDTRVLNNRTPLIDRASTLAEQFQQEGYRTFAVVSAYHLLHEESGLGQGFDRLDGPRLPERDAATSIDLLEEWTEDAVGQPLFVWLHLFDPHSPYGPPEPFDRKYYPGGADPFDPDREPEFPAAVVPPFLKGLTDRDYPYQQYRAEVDFVDQQMGRVLEVERYRDGIVAFTSDHGEAFGEHDVWWDHADLYPETVHVPLVLTWPDGPRGRRVDAPVNMIDLGRTLLDLCELDHVEFPGRDLRWALAEFPESQPRYLISAHRFNASLQSGRWLLILHLKNHQEPAVAVPRRAHEVELYDLEADPGCLENLVRDERHFDRAKKMRASLIEWLQSAPAHGLGASKVMSLQALESLEALGYGGGGGSDEVDDGSLYEEDPENEWCRLFSG